MAEEFVTITKKEYERLLDSELMLKAHRADLDHVRALNDRLIKENDWQRRLIQNLTEIAQRYFVR